MNRKQLLFIKSIFVLGIFFYSTFSFSQFDSMAVVILDKMSEKIHSTNSVSFTSYVEFDKQSPNSGLITHSEMAKVYLRGPNKILISYSGDNGQKSYYYNGKTFTYFSLTNNQYSVIDAPATNIETVDLLHNDYGMEFPAADFLYPNFVDDLIQHSKNLIYLGVTDVNGKEVSHIAGAGINEKMTYQFWIYNDTYLPAKIKIVYVDQPGNPQYQNTFSNWDIGPVLEDSMFEFQIPTGSKKVELKKSN